MVLSINSRLAMREMEGGPSWAIVVGADEGLHNIGEANAAFAKGGQSWSHWIF